MWYRRYRRIIIPVVCLVNVLHPFQQAHGHLAVHTDGAGEIGHVCFRILWQVLELPDERGRFHIHPVFREQGSLRIVAVREMLVGQVLVTGGEHDADFLEPVAGYPFAFGGKMVVESPYNLCDIHILLQFGKDVPCDDAPVFCRMGQTGFQFIACIHFHNFICLIMDYS